MLSTSKLMGFIPTRNSTRARDFYEGLLGLGFVSKDQFALVVNANGNMIRIVNTPEFTPAQYTVLGWEVADIESEARQLLKKGVELLRYSWIQQDDLGIWTTPSGSRVAWFSDPDGNVLSISQHPPGTS
jgi:predicted enzyme related to lactoylglutathione lyase